MIKLKSSFLKINSRLLSVKVLFRGSGEKHRRYLEKRYVISIKFLVLFGTLMYLIRYVRVPVSKVPNVPNVRDANVPVDLANVSNVPRDVRNVSYHNVVIIM